MKKALLVIGEFIVVLGIYYLAISQHTPYSQEQDSSLLSDPSGGVPASSIDLRDLRILVGYSLNVFAAKVIEGIDREPSSQDLLFPHT